MSKFYIIFFYMLLIYFFLFLGSYNEEVFKKIFKLFLNNFLKIINYYDGKILFLFFMNE